MTGDRVRKMSRVQSRPEKKERTTSEVSVSVGQATQGTFQNLTAGLGTGNSDHLTVGADKSCRNGQLPHPGLGTGRDLQPAVHMS